LVQAELQVCKELTMVLHLMALTLYSPLLHLQVVAVVLETETLMPKMRVEMVAHQVAELMPMEQQEQERHLQFKDITAGQVLVDSLAAVVVEVLAVLEFLAQVQETVLVEQV
jgi:hypothetical protein